MVKRKIQIALIHINRKFLSYILLLLTALIFSTSCNTEIHKTTIQKTSTSSTNSFAQLKTVSVTITGDRTKFTHKSHEKKQDESLFICEDCHQRNENSPVIVFPNHEACLSCHLVEFTAKTATSQGLCIICHQNAEQLLKNFPERKNFDVKFDSQQHKAHIEYQLPSNQNKITECAFCHKVESHGVAITYPSHPECYTCHKVVNDQVSQISGKHQIPNNCAVCHSLTNKAVQPLETRMVGKSYGYKFTHKLHTAIAKCQECHNLEGKYTNQVGTPKVRMHQVSKSTTSQGCFNCHNDKRAFGDTDFGKCQKCHSGLPKP